ncbi:helix-turn-helix domain-containing protein [Streptomyces sp. S07_1.15]|uniref:helix-turn-helix domain-containing protein n=1 Tax=Streptomyces sp. S07_1.15 TaxID=2873925 RepID=UPI001D144CFA|nr:helix-turn-helix domain-containing protein [Streptomyces sp. S07_1.15]MCC3652433.1 helix-turn-helix domain-containing protein [Streptomyces sp. S07_1.15]
MSTAPVAQRLNLPSTTVTLCLTWGAPLDLASDRDPPSGGGRDAVLLGLQTGPVISRTGGTGHGVQVELTPLGGYALLGMPLRHLADTMVHPVDVLGRHWGVALTGQLARASNWRSRWALLDEAISMRLADSRCWPSPVVSEAWTLLQASHGTLPVGRLAEATGRSRRRLEVLFAEQIGLTPKSAARVLRFQKALTRLLKPSATWAETAATCGYHDQAHLAREFRTFAGMTATALQELATHSAGGDTSPLAHPFTSVLAPP